jgi:hypothetical protein
MNKKRIGIFLIIAVLYSMISCKGISNPCDGIVCAPGFDCNNGKCECPSGNVVLGKNCFQDNEFVYKYSGQSNCGCFPKSFYFKYVINVVDTTKAKSRKDSSFYYQFFTEKGIGGQKIYRKFYPTGDSIYIFNAPWSDACVLNNYNAYPILKGKFTDAYSKLRLDIIWQTANSPSQPSKMLDSCRIVLRN